MLGLHQPALEIVRVMETTRILGPFVIPVLGNPCDEAGRLALCFIPDDWVIVRSK